MIRRQGEGKGGESGQQAEDMRLDTTNKTTSWQQANEKHDMRLDGRGHEASKEQPTIEFIGEGGNAQERREGEGRGQHRSSIRSWFRVEFYHGARTQPSGAGGSTTDGVSLAA